MSAQPQPGDRLTIVGAKEHNLRNVSLSLPRGKLVVFTGPSGSGKSSLAFDTIYAEGQRRYVESLSAYARQFLEQLAKPNVESIEGLSPAIAIEQRPLSKSPRSTVGTVTEIADYLRLLYARVGIPHCPQCGARIQAQTAEQIVDRLLTAPHGTKLTLLAPICRNRKSELKLELERLRREGYVRARIDGTVVDLGDSLAIDGRKPHDLDVVIDRVVIKDGVQARLTESVELALRTGEGAMLAWREGEEAEWLSERFACLSCGISLPPIEPRMFSFNGPNGACPSCDGLGEQQVIDIERVIGERTRTLREGVVLAWGKRGSVRLATEVKRAVDALDVPVDVPWSQLSEQQQQAILHGTEPEKRARARTARGYEGIIPRLQARLERAASHEPDDEDEDDERDLEQADDVQRFVVQRTCSQCNGQRLRREALGVHLGGKNLSELGVMPLRSLRAFVQSALDDPERFEFAQRERAVAEPLLRAVAARLGFLIDVGLDYLALDRSAMTLSSGEGQRIRLATQIGAALVGVLYVLDEPSVGLHARDNERLLQAQAKLRDLGNTVLVVEHDREAMLAADYLVDMGPGAGIHGGTVVAEGTPEQVLSNPNSITGPWLRGDKQLPMPAQRRAPKKDALVVCGARAHNLQNLTVRFPLGLLVAVTGVSGSGKSSLVIDTLLPAARTHLHHAHARDLQCDEVKGLDKIDKVISIDQGAIGRTPRSNAATYTGVFALLRELFASLPDARARGYKAGRFSFNVKGGRCESCAGDGVLRIEMHFLPDVFVTCEACHGLRYNRETLEIKYRGLNIAEVLALDVEQAEQLFEAVPKIRERLAALRQVGLGYIRLGQAATTLSGGEAQRVKLARELSRKATGNTLYVLDEPTTGLHFNDIEILLRALLQLRDQGNTVLLIEHNLDVVACADWVIDIGPEGGDGGGAVLAAGTPEQIAACERSHTGRFLREVLARRAPSPSRKTSKAKRS